jgi:hypothetical protein
MGNLNNSINVNVNAIRTHQILKANIKGNWCSEKKS